MCDRGGRGEGGGSYGKLPFQIWDAKAVIVIVSLTGTQWHFLICDF